MLKHSVFDHESYCGRFSFLSLKKIRRQGANHFSVLHVNEFVITLSTKINICLEGKEPYFT